MALGNNENQNNSPQNPFAFVLIPIVGFGLIAALITCYRYRRKKRLARIFGGPAYERELEAGVQQRRLRAQVDRGPGGGGGGRRAAGRRLGLGVGSREEGLNELGEAPPAYAPDVVGDGNGGTPKPPTPEGGVELTTYSQATAEAGTSRSPPGYGEEVPPGLPPPTGSAAGGENARAAAGGEGSSSSSSSRDDATGNNATHPPPPAVVNELTPPPRAVLPSS